MHRRHLQRLDDERAFALTRRPTPGCGAHRDAGHRRRRRDRSILPDATRAMAFRRTLRPRGEIAARLGRVAGLRRGARRSGAAASTGRERPGTGLHGARRDAGAGGRPARAVCGDIAEDTRPVVRHQAWSRAGRTRGAVDLDRRRGQDGLDRARGAVALPVPPGPCEPNSRDQVPELARAQADRHRPAGWRSSSPSRASRSSAKTARRSRHPRTTPDGSSQWSTSATASRSCRRPAGRSPRQR